MQDLNIANEDTIHLYNGSDISCNIGVQHDQEDQHNHFGGPAMKRTIQTNILKIKSKVTTSMKRLMTMLKRINEYI